MRVAASGQSGNCAASTLFSSRNRQTQNHQPLHQSICNQLRHRNRIQQQQQQHHNHHYATHTASSSSSRSTSTSATSSTHASTSTTNLKVYNQRTTAQFGKMSTNNITASNDNTSTTNLQRCQVSQTIDASGIVASIADTDEWRELVKHKVEVENLHLRDLMADDERLDSMIMEHDGMYCDFSRQRVTPKTMELLLKLAEKADLKTKIDAMFAGDRINETEDRSVLHVATRAPRDHTVLVEGRNVVPDVHSVLDRIRDFTEKVRNGEWLGATGKPLKDVVAIGIGGSYLGPLFVHTALRNDGFASSRATGRRLRFLANVDPVDVARALNDLEPESTLVVVVSKTFTTAETMLNARTVRTWITANLGSDAVRQHMVAVSTNIKLVKEFGIDPENAFGFWDWVGGRYSVCSAVGMLPLSLQYSADVMDDFLRGAWSVDEHFHQAPFHQNIPVLLGLISIWNVSFMNCPARAILPYCQAFAKLAPHIQQVSMESNGKGVDMSGMPIPFDAGEIDFGEPGTNGQHSFYQLIHQGRVVPVDFIGSIKSQQSVYLKGEIVSNHDELMCNFFAQADALAYGKTPVELRAENVPDTLIPHKTFTGNRPSTSILVPAVNAYTTGQILSLYEHRVAVQGFVWGINSFDQWGVELGKVLASKIRSLMNVTRTKNRVVSPTDGLNKSTSKLLNRYLEGKTVLLYPEPEDVFPCDIINNEHCTPPTSYP